MLLNQELLNTLTAQAKVMNPAAISSKQEGENPGIVVPMGLKCLESGTVIMECKNGAWEPLAKDEILKL